MKEDFAEIPGNPFVDHAMPAPETVEDLQCALREANGPRACGEPIIVIEQQSSYPLLRQIDCRCESDRSGANYDHAMLYRCCRVLIGRSGVIEYKSLVIGVRSRAGHTVLPPQVNFLFKRRYRLGPPTPPYLIPNSIPLSQYNPPITPHPNPP